MKIFGFNRSQFHTQRRIQFILKQHQAKWTKECYASEIGNGLLNSVRFVSHMIDKYLKSYTPDVVQVVDGNSIDREVTRFKPDIVVIEALWVTPEKIDELVRLHPDVMWIIRIHSEIPFLSTEGIAFDWMNRYLTNTKVRIASNSERMCRELPAVLKHPVLHLPNCYEFLD